LLFPWVGYDYEPLRFNAYALQSYISNNIFIAFLDSLKNRFLRLGLRIRADKTVTWQVRHLQSPTSNNEFPSIKCLELSVDQRF
jgi:hypothetical protein